MSRAKVLTAHGKSLTIAQWSCELGITERTIRSRLGKGWPVAEALSPLRQKHGCGKTAPTYIDHTGERHGMLVVDHYVGSGRLGPQWLCKCDCGRVRVVIARNLKYVYSCGCTRAHPRAKGNAQNTQPCWSCRKYAGKCSWSRKYPEPVEGWKATPTTKYQGTAGEVTSFAIHYCPEYVSDGTEGQG